MQLVKGKKRLSCCPGTGGERAEKAQFGVFFDFRQNR